MDSYTKKLIIIPEFDLGKLKNELDNISDVIKQNLSGSFTGFTSEVSSNIRKEIKDLEKEINTAVDNKELINSIDDIDIEVNTDFDKSIEETYKFKDFIKSIGADLVEDLFPDTSYKGRIKDLEKEILDLQNELVKTNIKTQEAKEKAKVIGGKDYENYQQLQTIQKEQSIQLSVAKLNEDKESINILQDSLEDIKSKLSAYEDLFDLDDNFKELHSILDEISDLEDESNKLNEDIKDKQKEIDEEEKTGRGQDFKNNSKNVSEFIKKEALNLLSSIGESILSFFKGLYTEAVKAIDEMASYDISNSLTYNKEAVEQAIQYGLTDAENYSLNKALEATGLSSVEDLYTASITSPEVLQTFQDKFDFYAKRYDDLADSDFFRNWQEYQLEMEEFKEEMTYDVAEFFIENKDTIKSFMKLGMDFMKTVVEILGWFTENLGNGERTDSQRTSATADIISSHSISNINNSKSVNQNNNYYGTNQKDSQWISDVSNMSYEQIIAALGG